MEIDQLESVLATVHSLLLAANVQDAANVVKSFVAGHLAKQLWKWMARPCRAAFANPAAGPPTTVDADCNAASLAS